MSQERVQKILAQAGITSRRKAEELIRMGSVTINGKVAQIGDKADIDADAIKVEGKLLKSKQAKVYLAFYKPRNVISTLSDPEGRPSIQNYLERVIERVFPIGRLDFSSEGLILLTNDGEIAEKLQKSKELVRVYHVKIRGALEPDMLEKLQKGMRTEEGAQIRPHSVRVEERLTSKTLLEVVMKGAGAADLKLLFDRHRLWVDRIVRVAIGQIQISNMKPGEFRPLEKSQITAIHEQPELGLTRIVKAAEKADAREERRSGTRGDFVRRPGVGARTNGRVIPASEGDRERRPARAPRSTGAGAGFGAKRSFEDRPSFGDRPARAPRAGAGGGFGAKRSFGERPSFGDRPARAPRAGAGGGFGAKRSGATSGRKSTITRRTPR